MTRQFHQPSRLTFWIIFFLFIQYGCSVNKFQKPITNFQTAAAIVTAHTRNVMTDLNRVQRNRMITRHRQENRPILLRDINASRLIEDADLKIRLKALDNLNEYIDLLVQIANSDAPYQIAKSAAGLSDALNNLTTTVSGLTNQGNSKFKNAFTSASPIIADLLRILSQKRIKEAIQTAILNGEKPVNDLIAAIGDDLEVAFIQQKLNLEEDRAGLLKQYNTEVSKSPGNDNALDDLSNQIMAQEDLMDDLVDANPRSALDAMAKAHSKLVAYAHDRSPGSFAEAVEAIEIFAAVGKKLGDAVLKLKAQNT
jgi:hypothetical protein